VNRERQRRGSTLLKRYFPDCRPTCKTLGGRPSPHKRHHVDATTGAQLYCRALYPKHVALMDAGAEHRERGMIAGNRVGKSDVGGFEVATHMTGLYPDWWQGRRFTEPVSVWAAGDTGKTTRNIIQRKLLGPIANPGTGFLPAHLITSTQKKSGVSGAIEMIWARHLPSGGMSICELKSYDQRREGFQGTAQHIIWLDEEPPEDVYAECLLRTTKTSDFPGGIILLTFTPLQGRTPLVTTFLKEGVRPDFESDD
jgi:phage terminase large subunit-like protein